MYRFDEIENRTDVINNIRTLYSYLNSDNEEEREWAIDRFKLGKWFVVEDIDGKLMFAPSRFVGYKNNTIEKHTENYGDGTQTNARLKKLKLYKEGYDDYIAEQFLSLMLSLGIDRSIPDFFIPEQWISPTENNKNNMEKNRYQRYIDLLKTNKNLILTGAPGTGKSYMAKEIAKEMKAEVAFVQFHPSYDYTDFVEGLRPTPPDNNGNIGFERKDGVFKEFCKRALSKKEVTYNKPSSNINKEQTYNTTSNDSLFDIVFKDLVNDIKNNQVELYSSKGKIMKVCIGKDKKGEEQIKFLSRSWRGVMTKDIKDIYNYYISRKRYDIRDAKRADFTPIVHKTTNSSFYRGIVQELLDRTPKGESVSAANTQYTHPAILPPAPKQETALDEQQDETPKSFVFIIDEINRGEISKIFGELFFSIEPSYRGDKVQVKTQYQNMITDESDPFFKGFYVPENVYIIGTMNDIDRSVESMDFAMRRRFAWQEIKAADNTAMLDDAFKDIPDAEALKDEVVGKMLRLNNAIWNEELNSGIDGLSPAYHIGGAYFCKLKDYLNEDADRDEAYGRLWENHLRGVLFEYLRGTANAAENMRKLKAAYDND